MSKTSEDICDIGNNISAFGSPWGCKLYQHSYVEGDFQVSLSYEQIDALYAYANRYRKDMESQLKTKNFGIRLIE